MARATNEYGLEAFFLLEYLKSERLWRWSSFLGVVQHKGTYALHQNVWQMRRGLNMMNSCPMLPHQPRLYHASLQRRATAPRRSPSPQHGHACNRPRSPLPLAGISLSTRPMLSAAAAALSGSSLNPQTCCPHPVVQTHGAPRGSKEGRWGRDPSPQAAGLNGGFALS